MQLSSKIRVAACVSLCACLTGALTGSTTFCAKAKAVQKGKLTALEGFVEQTPKFDTRLANIPFRLGANQTVLRGSERKNLLHAKLKLRNLRAKADQFYLKTTQNDVSLKSQTAKTAKSINIGTSKPLQGTVDKTGKPSLQALTPAVALTPFNTFERNVRAPFQLDLDKLMFKVAPNLSSAIDSQLDRVPVKAADRVAKQIKEMEPLLNARVPNRAMPDMPPKAKIDASDIGSIDKAIAQGEKMHGSGEKLDASGSKSRAVDKAAHEMDLQMSQVKKPSASASDLDAELNNAKNKIRTRFAMAQPGVDAILTHAHNLPQKGIPEALPLPNAGINSDVDDIVSWDKWHTKFAQLAHDPIMNNVSKLKVPSGANSVQITVTRNHTVSVLLVRPSNSNFDNAVVSAYKSLNQNIDLEFPRSSKRQSITLIVDNEHKGNGIPTGVESQPAVGDKEIVRNHI